MRLKADLTARRAEAEAELAKAERIVQTSAEDVRQAADLMESWPAIWQAARQGDPTAAYDMIGSIVPEGIAFQRGSIRTPFCVYRADETVNRTRGSQHIRQVGAIRPPVPRSPSFCEK